MIKRLILIKFMFFGLVSCTKSIDDLEKNELSYQELPTDVKNKVFDLEIGNVKYEDLNNDKKNKSYYRELNSPSRYNYYTKQKMFFPWVYKGYIENIKTKEIYSISRGKSVNYIIYGDSLYIPNHYNFYKEDSLNLTFTRFILK